MISMNRLMVDKIILKLIVCIFLVVLKDVGWLGWGLNRDC